jgi:DNA modification methylase
MPTLETISLAEKELNRRFEGKLVVNPDLNRKLVSFQANKSQNGYRWFKYKEGFSASLIGYLLERLRVDSGRLLDPFAGSGAALFGASKRGLSALGIELLPVGCRVVEARKLASSSAAPGIAEVFSRWIEEKSWQKSRRSTPFRHLRITQGAFPAEAEIALDHYVAASAEESEPTRAMLRFAAMCILEEISYTRKDGQYLRWDYRSARKQATKPFDKGTIPSLDEAIEAKLVQIRDDLRGAPSELFPELESGEIDVLCGSCLDHLPRLESRSFDCLITSPPYCNRYDYTRTYALELAFLGTSEDQLRTLRQEMVSCTVENREKEGLETRFAQDLFLRAKEAFEGQELLAQILRYLEARKEEKLLNNNGIPRMVRNYFREMSVVIFECARILKPGAPLIMVNDNVRYEGAGVPVDLILSDIARQAGFDVETIWMLPVGKGNSSQQMGKHGRDELRKCVYVWRAPKESRARGRDPRLVAGK